MERAFMRAKAARIEVRRHDWAAYRAPVSSGPSIPDVFQRLLDAGSAEEAAGFSLEYRLEVQSMVYEVALPALDVMLAAYVEDLPNWVESEFLNALHGIILGEPHRSELDLGNFDLVERCVQRARDGIWTLYARLSKFNADFLIDILDEIDTDRDRFEAYRHEFSEYL
ncbi:hypothetical protein [Actinoplanes sp. CA-252034]|uniref:hypothetical protein n=1 Tax=Actinoplanes sp. CA-252034 TaxID=3239906 RepID=UPI003D99CD56